MIVMLFLAAGALDPATTEPPQRPEVTVRGSRDNRVICQRVNANSGGSRLGAQRICLTEREWESNRDRSVELLQDMPRRNPRRAGRTLAPVLPQDE